MTAASKNLLKIRISLGSAILLGLTEGIMDAEPTTIYLLTYRTAKCTANCSFCSQARLSTGKASMLSRVIWPVFPLKKVADQLKIKKNLIRRICIQAMNYPNVFSDVLGLVRNINEAVDVPISISIQPLTSEQMKILKDEGVDRLGIPLDGASEKIFENVKGSAVCGPYLWQRSLDAIENAVKIFGRGRISTHFIVGLGESDEELINMIQKMVDMGVYPSLFAFTPLRGTRFEGKAQPPIERYRTIQLAHSLITGGKAKIGNIVFNDGCIRGFNIDEVIIKGIVKTGAPFLTSGCPGCNRPYYNERAGGPLYNYPRRLTSAEVEEVQESIRRYLNG